jgi:hypothetical protein
MRNDGVQVAGDPQPLGVDVGRLRAVRESPREVEPGVGNCVFARL